MQYLNEVVAALVDHKLRRATKYVSPTRVIRAHRIVGGRAIGNDPKVDGRSTEISVRLKIGPPNFHEREFIKDCIAAGEPFPIKQIQFAHFRPLKDEVKVKAKRKWAAKLARRKK